MWELYNRGPCTLTFYHKNGELFNGSMDEFNALFNSFCTGLKHKITNEVIILDYDGKIVARGSVRCGD